MKLVFALVATVFLFFTEHTSAAGLAASKQDCVEILAQWAQRPDSVPAHLVQGCQELFAADEVASVDEPIKDPCADPAAANSVQCWGPWAALNPAAGPEADADQQLVIHDEYDYRPQFADTASIGNDPTDPNTTNPPLTSDPMAPIDPIAPIDPMTPVVPITPIDPMTPVDPMTPIDPTTPVDPTNPPPFASCEAGASCGFAVLDPNFCALPEDQTVGGFDLANDGSAFVFDDAGDNEVRSLTNMSATSYQGEDAFHASNGTVESGVAGRFDTDDNGDLILASGLWGHGTEGFVEHGVSHTDRPADGGNFVWGVASSQQTLSELSTQGINNGGAGISLHFAGSLQRNTDTQAHITVNFGSSANWRGQWDAANTDHSFSAGGNVQGANLLSDASQFSANVDAGRSAIQGVLLGERHSLSVIHALDIALKNGALIKDVGHLIETQP